VFQGGTIAGIASKLDYLRGLGATALWIGPVFKQRADIPTYHGYAVQDFLEVDPRFGTRQELRDLVDQAHDKGLYVLLDIHHQSLRKQLVLRARRRGGRHARLPVRASLPLFRWRSKTGQPITTIGNDRDDGVWPREFQDTEFYTRAGSIKNFDAQPWENRLDPRTEFRRGDFFSLKDLRVQESAPFVADARAAAVTSALVRVYQYWIALLDIDGFRVDTIKHVSFEASRNFCGAIHEFTESIGKENFLVLGEVAGGAGLTRDYLDVFGRNLDAALDLGQPMDVLTSMIKGLGAPPADFFAQFGGHDELGTHREVGRYHVSVLDDHDMINRNPKARFCAGNAAATRFAQVAHAVGAQLTTLGIPCIYYGTEQALDGSEAYHDLAIEGLGEDGKIPSAIATSVRRCSAAASAPSAPAAVTSSISTIRPICASPRFARVVGGRDRTGKALRRGRQYPREVRFLAASGYQPPRQGELIAWSRVMFDREVVVALNTNGAAARGGDVTVDRTINPPGRLLTVLYRSDWSDAELRAPPAGQTVAVTDDNGRSTVRIDLPAAGMMILA
jgi:glycosidase